MSKYTSTTIYEAMNCIATNQYLLPAIQRKYVWSTEQIELLFDSIMREYPINSFMLWKITDKKVKQTQKFYTFLTDYCQKFGEDNPDAPSRLLKNDFFAVIDGQQRMTSIYIGLNGTYRYKKPSKWWIDSEENLPTRRLYLNLKAPLQTGIDNEMQYEFSFLSQEDLDSYSEDENYIWFKVGDILNFHDLNDVFMYLTEENLVSNKFATSTLSALWNKIHKEELINFYTITEQDQDKVLDVFIRTNSGGTELSFSDLLMSISSANWEKHDARKEIAETQQQIFNYGNPNFNVSQDFILKTILVLSSEDIRFKLENFSKDKVSEFENNWDSIKECLVNTFKLLESLGYSDSTIRAKNAVIPIVYYLYKNNLAKTILKPNSLKEEKKMILKWLNLSLLKGIFGGQSDGVLKKIRDIIQHDSTGKFPLDSIVKAFEGDPNKNYSMDDAFIETLLIEQYGSASCSLVLQLLYPDEVYKSGKAIAQDHMHPKTVFEDEKKISKLKLSKKKHEFYVNPENYNSVLNLELLNSSLNESKGDISLNDWVTQQKLKYTDLYVKGNTKLDIMSFENFIKDRREVLTDKLHRIISL